MKPHRSVYNRCETTPFSDSEAGSYLRLRDCVYHSTLGVRVIKKKKKPHRSVYNVANTRRLAPADANCFFFFITLKPRVE